MAKISGITGALSSVAAASGNASATAVLSAAQALLGANSSNFATITNARVYLNSGSLLGMAEKVTGIGQPKPATAEYKALGLISNMNLFTGFEQQEIKITWQSLFPELASALYNPMVVQRFQILASQEAYNANGVSSHRQVTALVNGYVTENSDVELENGSIATTESTIKVTYAKLTIGGKELYEFDLINNIYKVGGVDIFAKINSNMGG